MFPRGCEGGLGADLKGGGRPVKACSETVAEGVRWRMEGRRSYGRTYSKTGVRSTCPALYRYRVCRRPSREHAQMHAQKAHSQTHAQECMCNGCAKVCAQTHARMLSAFPGGRAWQQARAAQCGFQGLHQAAQAHHDTRDPQPGGSTDTHTGTCRHCRALTLVLPPRAHHLRPSPPTRRLVLDRSSTA